MILLLLLPNRVTLSKWQLWLSLRLAEQAIILTPEIVGRGDNDPVDDIDPYVDPHASKPTRGAS